VKLSHIGTLLAIAVLAGWFVFLRPVGLGGPASYIFVSGVSMQPTLVTGDLVVLQAADEYDVGDVIAFHIPDGEPGGGNLVIHRIIGGSAAEGFVVKGDNKPAPDDWRPTPDAIEGALWVRAPGAGAVVQTIRSPAVFAPIAAGLTVFFILLGGPRKPEPATPTPSVTR
jgi:signal peptidase I